MRLRIKDERKFNRFIFITILLSTLVIYAILNIFNSKVSEGNSLSKETVVVANGDSLWTIAENIESSRDIREIIYDIKQLNNLTSSEIKPGYRLYVPSY